MSCFCGVSVGMRVVVECARMSVVRIALRQSSYKHVFFLMIRRPPRSTLDRSSAASDVYKRQDVTLYELQGYGHGMFEPSVAPLLRWMQSKGSHQGLSLIHISEPTRPY